MITSNCRDNCWDIFDSAAIFNLQSKTNSEMSDSRPDALCPIYLLKTSVPINPIQFCDIYPSPSQKKDTKSVKCKERRMS